jgi:calcium-dependent protein kinase
MLSLTLSTSHTNTIATYYPLCAYDSRVYAQMPGVMMYQMLCGRMPFVPASRCLDKDAQFAGATWNKVSTGAKLLIKGLLERDPSKRLTAAEALAHPW